MNGAPKLSVAGGRPIIDYLTKDYEGFRQAMLDHARVLLPQWKSRSEADFGVVLVELFAYAADILSYYQDRVANEAYLPTATQRRSVTELLRLIGYQIDPGLAASALVHVEVTADVTVPASAGPYRIKTEGVAGEPDVVFEVTVGWSAKLVNNAIALPAAAILATGTAATVIPRAAHALAPRQVVYFEEKTIDGDGTPRLRRSPPLEVVRIDPLTASDDAITWSPALLEPFAAAHTVLKGNNLPATHGQTIVDEPVTVGDGTPAQRVRLSRKPVTHLVRDNLSSRRRSRPELEVRVGGVPWEEVDTFVKSQSGDRHYVTEVDENDYLTVVFGTGQRGAIVPAGAEIRAVYRTGLGAVGNVSSGSLTVAVTAVPQVKSVANPFAASGGTDHESSEEAKISGPGTIIAQERAVTLEDYELLSEAFPGVGKARARVGLRGGYKVVLVYVAPEAPKVIPPPPPSLDLKDALKLHLERRMPVNTMAGVDVLDPTYVPVDITVDVHALANARAADVEARVRAVLEEALGFAQQDFGTPVRVGDLYTALNRTEGVGFVLIQRLRRADGLVEEPDQPNHVCAPLDLPMADGEMAFRGTFVVNLFGGLP